MKGEKEANGGMDGGATWGEIRKGGNGGKMLRK